MPSTRIWPCDNIAHNLVRKAQHSHPLNQWLEWPNTYTWPCEEPILHAKRLCTYIYLTNDQKGSALTSIQPMIRKGPTLTSVQPMIRKGTTLTSIQQMIKKGSSLESVQPVIKKGFALTFNTYEEPIQHACLKMHALTSNLVGTNPTVISEWPPVPNWAT